MPYYNVVKPDALTKKPNIKLADDLFRYLKKEKLTLKAIVASHPHTDHARALTHLISQSSKNLPKRIQIYRSDDDAWTGTSKWLIPYDAAVAKSAKVTVINRGDKRRRRKVMAGVHVHMMTATGKTGGKKYRSVWAQLRYHDARILFTGDSYKVYEKGMLTQFGAQLDADLLKVTHHGSDGGTHKEFVDEVKPGLAIASSAPDSHHGIDKDTWTVLDNANVKVFETARKPNKNKTIQRKDVVVQTDGKRVGTGVAGRIIYKIRRLAPKLMKT